MNNTTDFRPELTRKPILPFLMVAWSLKFYLKKMSNGQINNLPLRSFVARIDSISKVLCSDISKKIKTNIHNNNKIKKIKDHPKMFFESPSFFLRDLGKWYWHCLDGMNTQYWIFPGKTLFNISFVFFQTEYW